MITLTTSQTEFLTRYLGFRRSKGHGESAAKGAENPKGAHPVAAEQNARLAKLTDDELARTDLTQVDPKQIFSKDNMKQLRHVEIKGEGDPKLKDLMREVVKGLSGVRRWDVMEALAAIVGVPPKADKLDLDYGRFLVVRKQQEVKGKAKGDDVPGLNEDKHPDFMASRGQLLFGKVLGEAFGIHEIFAALLSPTGGLAGPGNKLMGPIDALHLAADNPIGLHGTVHDAAGYLNTFHDEGPGYNYLNSKVEIFGTGNPLSGQFSGIAFWTAEAGKDYFDRRTEAAVLEVEKKLKSARDAVAGTIDSLLARFMQKGDAATGDVLDVAEAIGDGVNKVAKTAVEPFEADAGPAMPEKAKDKLNAAASFIWS